MDTTLTVFKKGFKKTKVRYLTPNLQEILWQDGHYWFSVCDYIYPWGSKFILNNKRRLVVGFKVKRLKS